MMRNNVFSKIILSLQKLNQTTMKSKLLLSLFILSLSLSTTSCIVTRHHAKGPHKKEVPPGHAKKHHGKKSAKFEVPPHHRR